MKRAFIFPGQGSQYIGMGKSLADNFAEAREVFQEVDDALSQSLSAMMFDGAESDLNMTENTQPALMAVSVAVVKVLEKQGGFSLKDKAEFVAGHSLGEYSALTAAGSFDIATASRLLKTRGQAMQKAVPVGVGAMAAILGLNFDVIKKVAQETTAAVAGEVCEIANDNCDGQVVLSGHKAAIEKSVEIAKEHGAKRAVILPVSAPFHCSLMKPAADVMEGALAEATMNAPALPVICNVTAAAETAPDALRDNLVKQVAGMVRWRESVMQMKEQGIEDMVELGAGKVLCGLIRRIDSDITTQAVETPEQIEALLEALNS